MESSLWLRQKGNASLLEIWLHQWLTYSPYLVDDSFAVGYDVTFEADSYILDWTIIQTEKAYKVYQLLAHETDGWANLWYQAARTNALVPIKEIFDISGHLLYMS